jgi:hypothetical protein
MAHAEADQTSNRKFQRSAIGYDSACQPADMGVPEPAPVPSWGFPVMGPPAGAASAAAERQVPEGAFGLWLMGVLVL